MVDVHETHVDSPAQAFSRTLDTRHAEGFSQLSADGADSVELVPDDTFSMVPTAMYAYARRRMAARDVADGQRQATTQWLETYEPTTQMQTNFFVMGDAICWQRFSGDVLQRPRNARLAQAALQEALSGTSDSSPVAEGILTPAQEQELLEWLAHAPAMRETKK